MDAALTTSGQTQVCICLGENLHVQKLKNARVIESEDAFQDEYMWRVDRGGSLFSLVLLE